MSVENQTLQAKWRKEMMKSTERKEDLWAGITEMTDVVSKAT